MARPDLDRIAARISEELTDRGVLVQGGWLTFNSVCLPADMSDNMRDICRIAFFAGSQHLWSSVMTILDPNTEPTARDMARMNSIHGELQQFAKELREAILCDAKLPP